MESNYKNTLCTAIKLLRKKHNLSQEKFAEICDINADNLRNLEYCRHSPKPKTIDKICNAFNIDIIELLSLTLNESSEQEKIIISIKTLREKQLTMLSDFIALMKKY